MYERERYQDTIDHRSYTHNSEQLSNLRLKFHNCMSWYAASHFTSSAWEEFRTKENDWGSFTVTQHHSNGVEMIWILRPSSVRAFSLSFTERYAFRRDVASALFRKRSVAWRLDYVVSSFVSKPLPHFTYSPIHKEYDFHKGDNFQLSLGLHGILWKKILSLSHYFRRPPGHRISAPCLHCYESPRI